MRAEKFKFFLLFSIEIRIFDRDKKSERVSYLEGVRVIRMWSGIEELNLRAARPPPSLSLFARVGKPHFRKGKLPAVSASRKRHADGVFSRLPLVPRFGTPETGGDSSIHA